MSDEEFDEESLRAAALKSMGAKKTVPESQKFTPLPRPDFNPTMHQQPIPSRVPHLNYGQMNFAPSNLHNQYNFGQGYNDYSYYNGYNGYQSSHLVPPINQFRHNHPRHFNYPVRPGGFNSHQMFNNQRPQQYHQNQNHQMNQNNHVMRHSKHAQNSIPIRTGESSQSHSTAPSNSIESSSESRRLPERFSRIERSDSESDEDDRLDEFVDDDDANSQESEVREVEDNVEEVPNGLNSSNDVEEETDLVLCENIDDDDLLREDIADNNESDCEDAVEESDAELTPKHGSSQSDCESDASKSPVRPPSRRVVIVASDTPEKIASEPEVEIPPMKPIPKVPEATESVAPRTIKLKVDGGVNAMERRRLKFGLVNDDIQSNNTRGNRRSTDGNRNVRIPSFEGEDRDSSPGPSRKKLRSFVVLKK